MKSFEAAFRERMYEPGIPFYQDHLCNLGFAGHRNVLDAGCGFGQWTMALAALNESVVGMDILRSRVAHGHSQCGGKTFLIGSIEDIPFAGEFFDAVFCFSVILFTDVSKTLKEFWRVLRPGGKLYLNDNGVGYYIYELLIKRRLGTLNVFWDSMIFGLTDYRPPGTRLISSVAKTKDELKKAGFSQIEILKEGTRLFKPRYFGLEGVFEMIAER